MKKTREEIQQEVDKNYDYFKKNLFEIKSRRPGKKFVLLRKQKAIGYFDTVDDAIESGELLYEDGLYSVQEIDARKVELGFQTYALFHK